MSDFYLEYELEGGYLHNWLIAGPLEIPIPDLAPSANNEDRLQIVQRFHQQASDIHEPPIERGTFQVGGQELDWRYTRCLDDHWIDLSATYPSANYLRAWAYAQLESPVDQEIALTLTTNSLADVWLNRTHVHRYHPTSLHDPQGTSFQGTLQEGSNEILVRLETAARGDCLYLMALQLGDALAHDVTVRLPVPYGNVYRRQKLERVFEHAHLEHTISVRGANVIFHWDEELEETEEPGHWVREESGLIRVYGQAHAEPGSSNRIGGGQLTLDQGPHHVALIPPSHVIERYNIRYERRLPFYVLEHAPSGAYYGTYPERRQEALDHSARQPGSLYAEIARAALGHWPAMDQGIVSEAMRRIERREAGGVVDLAGVLGAIRRYPILRVLAPEVRQTIQDTVLTLAYGRDKPVSGAAESDEILLYTCEMLAGQCFPEHTFSVTGHDGQWHRAHGADCALAWLLKTGTEGFGEWDSHKGYQRIVVALTHLSDLAQNEEVRERAAIVLDKLFFTIAVNSFRGVFGSTHAHARASMIAGGQLEATSGLTRLLWGMGVWNQHISGLVALAASEYELPTMIASIAVDLDGEMWHKEHHPGVNKVTYRTPDYMLCSAQDYRPGERGRDEHIWQATLGPDAVVFVNHPPCVSESDAHKPNYWAGNGVLPRVAQWKDVLIATYALPEDDRLGFCHAYYPVYEFDEVEIEPKRVFARQGAAYIALACSQELHLITRGPGAFRELRAYGSKQVWLCMMGREAVDGSFEAFRDKVRALDIQWRELGVQFETLAGQTLSFAREDPLLVDGKKQPLGEYRHYDGPHCTAEWPSPEMDIHYGDYALRLHLGA